MMVRNRRVIDAGAIRDNMAAIRAAVPETAKVMAVVKADGYGHGSICAAKAALAGGAVALAVATVGEGEVLRRGGITEPEILVLGAVSEADVREGVELNLTQTVCSPEMVRICQEAAARSGKTAKVHLKVDTGMGRIGVRTMDERDAVLREIENAGMVNLTGAYTHFSDADGGEEGQEYTEKQFRRFLEMTDDLHVTRHCANSAAALLRPDLALDMVREGISLYGYPPVETGLNLRPCMRWEAKVSFVKDLPEGECVSYGRTWTSARPTRVATVTCGYGDGYHRAASGQAEVLIHGKRAKIIGRICMDQMMADVTEIPDVKPEDPVILMGTDGEETITAEDIARWSGTISYEVLLSCGNRVERTEA